jgi:hypothetical protein
MIESRILDTVLVAVEGDPSTKIIRFEEIEEGDVVLQVSRGVLRAGQVTRQAGTGSSWLSDYGAIAFKKSPEPIYLLERRPETLGREARVRWQERQRIKKMSSRLSNKRPF